MESRTSTGTRAPRGAWYCAYSINALLVVADEGLRLTTASCIPRNSHWRLSKGGALAISYWRPLLQGVGKVGGWWRLGRFDGALTGWCVARTGARAP